MFYIAEMHFQLPLEKKLISFHAFAVLFSSILYI